MLARRAYSSVGAASLVIGSTKFGRMYRVRTLELWDGRRHLP